MYFFLGVLIATLVALLVLPAVWHRAVRLTTKRVEAAVPVSIFEIQADKDQQRAAFAVSQRRLELQLDQARNTLVAQATTIERQRQRIFNLEQQLTAQKAAQRGLTRICLHPTGQPKTQRTATPTWATRLRPLSRVLFSHGDALSDTLPAFSTR